MTDDDKIEPKLSETGFYKTVHDAIELAMNHYDIFIFKSGTSFDDYAYVGAVATLTNIYNSVIAPHNLNHPNDIEVIDFQEKWDKLNEEYGDGFEKGLRKYKYNGEWEQKILIQEYVERYNLIMTYMNTLGLTQIKQRGEAWEDAELEAMWRELK